MKIGTVSLGEMIQNNKWRANLFIDDISNINSERFDLITLGEVVVESKISRDPYGLPSGGFYYIGLENVEPVTGEPVGVKLLTSAEVRSRSKLFEEGDILYGRLRPYLRKALLVEGPYLNGLCSTEFIVLRAKTEKILPLFLRELLVSVPVTNLIKRHQAGAALPRVSSKDLLRIKVPVPSLEYQESCVRRIGSSIIQRRELVKELSIVSEEGQRIVAEVFD